jgi:hypothetical protein
MNKEGKLRTKRRERRDEGNMNKECKFRAMRRLRRGRRDNDMNDEQARKTKK